MQTWRVVAADDVMVAVISQIGLHATAVYKALGSARKRQSRRSHLRSAVTLTQEREAVQVVYKNAR